MINEKYADYAWEQTAALLAIDSPSGFTRRAAEWVKTAFEALGFPAKITTKGGVLADLGGENADDGLFLEAHSDTLGAMVAQIKGSGRLRLTAVGGMEPNNAEAENVRIYTRSGKVYDGTCQLCNASVHVNGEYGSTKRSYDTVEVVPDEDVSTAEDTRKLGIEVGDFVCFDPRTRRTASGYLKSRFLDDKLSVGILLGFAKYLADNRITLPRRTYVHVTVYEEVGHGGASSVPAGGDGGHFRGHGLRGRGPAVHRAGGLHLRQGFRRALRLRRHHRLGGGRQGSRGRLRRGCVSPLRQRRRGRPACRV